IFFFSSRRRHTRFSRDWSSDVCSSDLKYETGKDYPIYLRRKDEQGAQQQVIFDCNAMAEGHSYFNLNGINISPDNKLAVFGVDRSEERRVGKECRSRWCPSR